jgi:hypothetical protein
MISVSPFQPESYIALGRYGGFSSDDYYGNSGGGAGGSYSGGGGGYSGSESSRWPATFGLIKRHHRLRSERRRKWRILRFHWEKRI